MDLTAIAKWAVKNGASDIHIKVGVPPMVRINGDIRSIPKAPKVSQELAGQMAWSIMNASQRERFKASSDLDMAWAAPSVGRFRVNVFRQRARIGMVLRVIPTKVFTIDELNLPNAIRTMSLEPRGLLLVTGVTGSGKSTTLASMIEEINRTKPHHILTIEDPIEFTFQDRTSIVNQREVGQDSQSFHSALRAALRQDPDVILVGELRDKETMEIALSAAETGHLVMGTLHTLNASQAISRIVDFFEPHHQNMIRHQIAGSLVGIVSQRLVPRKGGGRIAAVEVMVNKGAVTECITDPSRVKEITDLLSKGTAQYGTQTFDQCLYWHYNDGNITKDDALGYASNPEDLTLRMSGIASEEWNKPLADQ